MNFLQISMGLKYICRMAEVCLCMEKCNFWFLDLWVKILSVNTQWCLYECFARSYGHWNKQGMSGPLASKAVINSLNAFLLENINSLCFALARDCLGSSLAEAHRVPTASFPCVCCHLAAAALSRPALLRRLPAGNVGPAVCNQAQCGNEHMASSQITSLTICFLLSSATITYCHQQCCFSDTKMH